MSKRATTLKKKGKNKPKRPASSWQPTLKHYFGGKVKRYIIYEINKNSSWYAISLIIVCAGPANNFSLCQEPLKESALVKIKARNH